MQITCWKSDDGKLFEFEQEYKKHQKKLARERLAQKKYDDAVKLEEKWWKDTFFDSVKSPDQLIHVLKMHVEKLVATGINSYFCNDSKKKQMMKTITKVKFHNLDFDFGYSKLCSNSHHAPINGVTNWYRKDDLPMGYPGLNGHVRYSVIWDKKFSGLYPCGSDMWDAIRIKTGTGGGGGMTLLHDDVYCQAFSYDYRLFLDDWPAMRDAFEAAQVMRELIDDHRSVVNIVNEMYPASAYSVDPKI